MRYLLDTHTLSKNLLNKSLKRDDLYVLQEVVDEWAYSKVEVASITSSGIRVIQIAKKHLDKLIEVLGVHGDNFKLIRLYTGEGTADVVMLAYVLSERDAPDTLFPEEYTLVTKDKELSLVAKSYGIRCVSDVP